MEELEQNKVEVIKSDAVITVKFGRDFYVRLTLILQHLIDNKTAEQMQEAADQINNKDIKEAWILAYETMLYLLKGAEEYCQQNGMTEWVDASQVNPPETPSPSNETQSSDNQ